MAGRPKKLDFLSKITHLRENCHIHPHPPIISSSLRLQICPFLRTARSPPRSSFVKLLCRDSKLHPVLRRHSVFLRHHPKPTSQLQTNALARIIKSSQLYPLPFPLDLRHPQQQMLWVQVRPMGFKITTGGFQKGVLRLDGDMNRKARLKKSQKLHLVFLVHSKSQIHTKRFHGAITTLHHPQHRKCPLKLPFASRVIWLALVYPSHTSLYQPGLPVPPVLQVFHHSLSSVEIRPQLPIRERGVHLDVGGYSQAQASANYLYRNKHRTGTTTHYLPLVCVQTMTHTWGLTSLI